MPGRNKSSLSFVNESFRRWESSATGAQRSKVWLPLEAESSSYRQRVNHKTSPRKRKLKVTARLRPGEVPEINLSMLALDFCPVAITGQIDAVLNVRLVVFKQKFPDKLYFRWKTRPTRSLSNLQVFSIDLCQLSIFKLLLVCYSINSGIINRISVFKQNTFEGDRNQVSMKQNEVVE